eukprot:gb/GECG01010383.1/.p1 GENE.gb/GECG01010383.1/~~gb/GECG01010383.1/.p1  ORF type:complete len:385 (+),score=52.69 gb/GECG01010383.1/:1-1155(+)
MLVFAVTPLPLSLMQNYQPEATVNDGTCALPPGLTEGCMCRDALNYNATADINVAGGICEYANPPEGCAYLAGLNYDITAEVDNGTCKIGTKEELLNKTLAMEAHNDYLRYRIELSRELIANTTRTLESTRARTSELEQKIAETNARIPEVKAKNAELRQQLNSITKRRKKLHEESTETRGKIRRTRAEIESTRNDMWLTVNRTKELNSSVDKLRASISPKVPMCSRPEIQKQIVSFERSRYRISVSASSVGVVLKRRCNNGSLPNGQVYTKVKAKSDSAIGGIDFVPVDRVLKWEEGESHKVFTVHLKTSSLERRRLRFQVEHFSFSDSADKILLMPPENQKIHLEIEPESSGPTDTEDQEARVARHQQSWWKYWFEELEEPS